MERDQLISSLLHTDPAAQDCSVALAAGADFEVSPRTTYTADLINIYARRAKHVAAIGLEHGGFDQALSDLASNGAKKVRLGWVLDGAGHRYYVLFLAAEADDLVACLWVHQTS